MANKEALEFVLSKKKYIPMVQDYLLYYTRKNVIKKDILYFFSVHSIIDLLLY